MSAAPPRRRTSDELTVKERLALPQHEYDAYMAERYYGLAPLSPRQGQGEADRPRR